MSIRSPVSPPARGRGPGSYKCYVDSDGKIWEVFWEGSMMYPDLDSVTLHRVEISDELSASWSSSKLVDFGSNAVIRTSEYGEYPILKIAHPDTAARQLIQHEYATMKALASCAGIAKVGPEPLVDSGGVFGFRLERLWKIDFDTIKMQGIEVQAILDALHETGYCHGDLSPSNVMKNALHQLVLIDFSFAGVIGQKVPPYIPRWVYRSEVFETRQDNARLVKYFSDRESVSMVT